MTKKLNILLIFLLTFPSLLWAYQPKGENQDSTQHKTWYNTIADDFCSALDDYYELGTSALEFKSKDQVKFATSLSATLLAMSLDNELRSLVKDSHTPERIDVFRAFTQGGEIKYAAPFCGAVYLGGLISGIEDVRVTGRLLLESLALSGLVNLTLKAALGRSRPFKENGNSDFRFFQIKDDFHSMPSGHTTVAFAISSVLSERINNIYASVGLYSLAGAVGFSRIYLDRHWLSDVVAGAALGTLSGIAVSNAEKRNRVKSERNISFYPVPYGIGIIYTF